MGAFSLIVVINLLNRIVMNKVTTLNRKISRCCCYLCLRRASSSNSSEPFVKRYPLAKKYFGDSFVHNVPRKLIRDTPPKLKYEEPAPLFKYTEDYKDEALKNASDWLEREKSHQFFGDGEKESYKANWLKYKKEYMEYIGKIQNEISYHYKLSETHEAQLSKKVSTQQKASSQELNNQWNEEIRQLRDRHNQKVTERQSGVSFKKVTGDPRIDSTAEYITEVLQIKSSRLENVVTEQSLDERIAAALSLPTLADFNFALDSSRNVYHGVLFDKQRTRKWNEMFAAGFSEGMIGERSFLPGAPAGQLDFDDADDEDVEEREDVAQELGDIFGDGDDMDFMSDGESTDKL